MPCEERFSKYPTLLYSVVCVFLLQSRRGGMKVGNSATDVGLSKASILRGHRNAPTIRAASGHEGDKLFPIFHCTIS